MRRQSCAVRCSGTKRRRTCSSALTRNCKAKNWIASFRSAADPYLYIMLRWADMFGFDLTDLPQLAAFKQPGRGLRRRLVMRRMHHPTLPMSVRPPDDFHCRTDAIANQTAQAGRPLHELVRRTHYRVLDPCFPSGGWFFTPETLPLEGTFSGNRSRRRDHPFRSRSGGHQLSPPGVLVAVGALFFGIPLIGRIGRIHSALAITTRYRPACAPSPRLKRLLSPPWPPRALQPRPGPLLPACSSGRPTTARNSARKDWCLR